MAGVSAGSWPWGAHVSSLPLVAGWGLGFSGDSQPARNEGNDTHVPQGQLPAEAPPTLPIQAVCADVITPSQRAAMSTGLRAGMVLKAPLTVRKVHALHAEAVALERHLADAASRKAVRAVTVLQTTR